MRLPDAFHSSEHPQIVAPVAASSAEEAKPTVVGLPEGELTVFQANLLVAMLGGFWGRRGDGHPGPDLLGRGLMELDRLVKWERLKASGAGTKTHGTDPPSSNRNPPRFPQQKTPDKINDG